MQEHMTVEYKDYIYNHRNVRMYNPINAYIKNIIIIVHGGCFHDGDHTWNASQATSLSHNTHSIVFVPYYPQDNLTETTKYLTDYVIFVKNTVPSVKLVIMGSSSGGFHALNIASLGLVDYCFALCPVADP